MRAHPVVETVGGVVQGALEPEIGEGLDLAAPVAHEVMVVELSDRVRGLEASDPVAELDALDEPQLDELVERPVDACNADASAPCADVVEDLLRRATARLRAEPLDHRAPSSPVPEPLRP